ncbi:MAG: terminase family protein [Nitrospirae bacterium]|nr:terminase family protein [Nitrospirota bacterium]
MNGSKYFLPYQIRWLGDDSPVKIWEKSRRIGATYVQSYEDVREVAHGKWDVWFSSADESAAREYILYCAKWAKLFDKAAKYLGIVVLDSEKDIKAYVVTFANGKRINALSSNPKAFRSKGGKVILDEFGWHEDAETLWSAARPCITWGFPLRILSTHNGTNCRYFKFIEGVKKGKLHWSHHVTTIQLAVEEGLVDKILGRKATEEEKENWLQEQRESCFDENTWLQEYCCVPVDEASAFLTYELISNCEMDDIIKPLLEIQGDLYGGMDIGRKKDLSVIWLLEKLGAVKYTRQVKTMEKTPFHMQRDALFEILKHPRMRRFCIDATGIGMQLSEEAQEGYGKFKVEAVTFSNTVKEDLAYGVKNTMEDRQIYIPAEFEIREDFHSIRKVTTAAGNIRFDVAATEARGHADRFWAFALANHAASDKSTGPIHVISRKKRESHKMLAGYD